jgi:hypothetical protein
LIEPNHPIHNYDVTFSLPTTGPLTQASIAAQFCCQERYWVENDGMFARYVPHTYSKIAIVASDREPNRYLECIRKAADWHNEQGHQPPINKVYHWLCD